MLNRAAKALVFPLEDRSWAPKIAIGGGVGLLLQALFVGLGFLFTREFAPAGSLLAQAANFPALGFALATFQGALAIPQTDSLPGWRPWASLCVKGLLLFALAMAYETVPLLFVVSGFSLLVKGGAKLVLGIALIMVGMLAGITAGFFLPMGIARYLSERRLEAALHPAIVWLRIRKVLAEYVEAYLLTLGSFIVAGLIGAIPVLGLLVWPFLTFYLLVAGARLFGGICSDT
ncbi:membrane protein [Candidatus Methylomirabilis lanthanidiphila]|uniref:Membrane protein n=1 Tax=Candidatus Methylomirabilis lanthanidiphila TaxID=2211376 RepID=A0A564ZFV8_9BACT|nr:DUF4013 domain-containing protein [Candidatus Methylomirabilis lanthanidiphila]VUZ83757.1 membrane protein [Candidatus Methylomirabilis lanthanidiphila]